MNRQLTLVLALTLATSPLLVAQDGGSIFSDANFGDLVAATTPASVGRAGIESTVASNTTLAWSNPASWSSLSSVSIQIGMQFDQIRRSQAEQAVHGNGVKLDHLAVGFPVSDSLGITIAAGIRPFSRVDFAYGRSLQIASLDTVVEGSAVFSGTGGLSEGFFGIAAGPTDEISIGASVGALFGSRERVSRISTSTGGFSDVGFLEADRYSGLVLRTGIQLRPLDNLTVGFSGALPASVSVDRSVVGLYATSIGDDTASSTEAQFDRSIPAELRGGVGLVLGRTAIGTDIILQQWSSSDFVDARDRLRTALGVEYLPRRGPTASGLERWTLRTGLYREQTYVTVEGSGVDELGGSIGATIPFATSGLLGTGAALDVGVGVWSRSSPTVDELGVRVAVGLSVNETWFR